MKSFAYLVAGAGFSLTLAPLHAASTQDAAANAEDVNSGMEVVCRRMAPQTGSRIGARNICKTVREWAVIDAENRGVVEDEGNRNRFGNQDVFGPQGANCGSFGSSC